MGAGSPWRRHHLRAENITKKKVGVVVPATPFKRRELKASARQVREERCQFQGPQLQIHASVAPLFPKDRAQQSRTLRGRSLESELHAHPAVCRDSRVAR